MGEQIVCKRSKGQKCIVEVSDRLHLEEGSVKKIQVTDNLPLIKRNNSEILQNLDVVFFCCFFLVKVLSPPLWVGLCVKRMHHDLLQAAGSGNCFFCGGGTFMAPFKGWHLKHRKEGTKEETSFNQSKQLKGQSSPLWNDLLSNRILEKQAKVFIHARLMVSLMSASTYKTTVSHSCYIN